MDFYKIMHGNLFYCKTCKFKITNLAQTEKKIEGCCPSYGSYNIDYMNTKKMEKYVNELISDFESI